MNKIAEHLNKVIFGFQLRINDGDFKEFIVLRIGTVYLLSIIGITWFLL